MSAPGTGTAVRRGRPRDAAVDVRVVDTVLRLIGEGASIADLTMEGIAREAGVAKATVYRRWAGKDALLLDVLAAIEPPPVARRSGSLRDDLVAAVEYIRLRGLAKRESGLMRSMMAQMESSPELWRRYRDTVVAARRRLLTDLLARGVAEGGIRPELGGDLDLLADMVAGPVLARATLRPDAPLPPDLAERVVDILLQGMRPHDRPRD
ncbi:TetR/AcrR family transcriptional regulator [Actinacidiphila yeochonensis]|uniref:TetR/AcrR family transcriptional regulator n=1 Tax=Actinacidiphila yeochonensis TaxID=89050 RepID=UPI00055F3035|nr:TetR/AcrR family transcriptional regulator [Actinacidiphila yeochonensis]